MHLSIYEKTLLYWFVQIWGILLLIALNYKDNEIIITKREKHDMDNWYNHIYSCYILHWRI